MKSKNTWLWLLVMISTLGLLTLQLYMLKNAYNLAQENFDRNVYIALDGVSDDIVKERIKSKFHSYSGNDSKGKNSFQIKIVEKNIDTTSEVKVFREKLESINIQGDSVFQFENDIKLEFDSDELAEINNGNKHKELIKRFKENDSTFSTDSKTIKIWAERLANEAFSFHSIEQIADTSLLDSLIQKNLKQRSLPLNFEFHVSDDSLMEEKGEMFSKNLFPNDVLHSPLVLNLSVDGKNYAVMKNILWPLVLSLLFIAITLLTFYKVITLYSQQKRISDIKSDFINSMSHELKTPLATIGVCVKSLGQSTENQGKLLGVIAEENSRMIDYVNNILRLAVVDKPHYELDLNELKIHDFINRMRTSMEVAVKGKEGSVSFEIEDLPQTVFADEGHLRNVVYNLFHNSLNYCRRVPKIKWTIHEQDGMMLFKIQDNGIGIKQEDQKRIFDKFYRSQKGDIYEFKGTGIGLSYSQQIIKLHGGFIELNESSSEGSTFTISIPINRSNESITG